MPASQHCDHADKFSHKSNCSESREAFFITDTAADRVFSRDNQELSQNRGSLHVLRELAAKGAPAHETWLRKWPARVFGTVCYPAGTFWRTRIRCRTGEHNPFTDKNHVVCAQHVPRLQCPSSSP